MGRMTDGLKLPSIGPPGAAASSMSAVVATKHLARSKRKRRSEKGGRSPVLYQYVVGKGARRRPLLPSSPALRNRSFAMHPQVTTRG